MIYDAIIIGAGPAGMTAGIYLARGGYKILILEKETIGGQIASSPVVENYPGFTSISGAELTGNMYDQVEALGVEIEIENVKAIKNGDIKKVLTEDNTYEAKTVIIATGSKYRTLGLPIEEKFIGNGIHFCVSCDGAFYKGRTVAVIGGGNSAITNALYLADLADKVYIIQVIDKLSCEKALEEKILSKPKAEILLNTKVTAFIGDKYLDSIKVQTGAEEKEIKIDGCFESVGMDAQTDLAVGLIKTNENKYIISENCETEVEGVYVAGDCRAKDIRQLTTAVADGTTAAILAIKHLKQKD